MSLFPDPLSDALVAKLEKEVVNALLSSQLSAYISFLWTLGVKNLWGLGPALRAMAVSQYLSLREIEAKGFLVLTVPTEMLSNADLLAKFNTEFKSK